MCFPSISRLRVCVCAHKKMYECSNRNHIHIYIFKSKAKKIIIFLQNFLKVLMYVYECVWVCVWVSELYIKELMQQPIRKSPECIYVCVFVISATKQVSFGCVIYIYTQESLFGWTCKCNYDNTQQSKNGKKQKSEKVTCLPVLNDFCRYTIFCARWNNLNEYMSVYMCVRWQWIFFDLFCDLCIMFFFVN